MLGKNGKPPNKGFMEAMPYTQSLLANGMGVGYHAIAAAPTVTMPRLKVSVNFSFKCGSVKRTYDLSFLFFFFFFNFLFYLAFFLQAMVSGAIGGFLDVASNFNSQAYSDDNLIG